MITKEDISLAFHKIGKSRIARIGDAVYGLFLQPVNFGQKLHMSALVYLGDKFIPFSVRKAASSTLAYKPSIDTWLAIDEERFLITLHFLDDWNSEDEHSLHELTSQFEETAVRWREIFEEKDRQDLVPIHHSR